MVSISLDLKQDTHERLASLSEFYDKDIKEIINEIIEVVSFESMWIQNISNEYRVPIRLTNVLSHLLHVGVQSTNALFNDILGRLEGKGLFFASDMDIDLDEMRIWVNYDALRGCDLYVHSFDVTLTGLPRLTATYLMDVEKVDETALLRMKEIADNINDIEGLELPEAFLDIMEFSVDVVDEDEFLYLNVDIVEESLPYLPTIPAISEVIKQIMERAGVNLPIDE